MAGSDPVRIGWPGRRPSAPKRAAPRHRILARVGDAGAEPSGRLFLGDNLDAVSLLGLRGARLDLVYLDPPFWTGKKREGSRGGYRDVWESAGAYLNQLQDVLSGIRGLLSPRGQVFVHVDWRVSHWVRCLMDEVFGLDSFRNEIVWHYSSGGRATRYYRRKWDALLWYAPGDHYVFRPERTGLPRGVCPKCRQMVPLPNHMKVGVDEEGRRYRSIRSGGRVYRYYDDERVAPSDVWLDISHLQQKDPERTGYPTQKPLALLERIVLAHSEPGQVVADLYCGSGTTLVAAHRHGRNWVGCDREDAAVALTQERLALEVDRSGGSFVVEALGRLAEESGENRDV